MRGPPFTLRHTQGERSLLRPRCDPFVLSLSKHECTMSQLNRDSVLRVLRFWEPHLRLAQPQRRNPAPELALAGHRLHVSVPLQREGGHP